MESITLKDCSLLLEKCFKDTKLKLLIFKRVPSSDTSFGLMGSTEILVIRFENTGKVNEITFFVKRRPIGNTFHNDYLENTGSFFKEAGFYHHIVKEIEPYLHRKIIPICYIVKSDKCLIMEDLSSLGYKTQAVRETFDFKHCQIALQALASLQAASLAYEEYNNTTLDKSFPDLLFETLYVRNDTHHGFKHLTTSIKAMKMILDKYFQNTPKEVVQKALEIYESLPDRVMPSRRHRNALSHADLWCNNIMFSYKTQVDSACIVDLQLMRYNPPALDALMLIFLNTSKELREKNMDVLVKDYFNYLQNEIKKSNLNPENIITWGQFKSSISEILPTALSITSLFLHFVLLPQEFLNQILVNVDDLKTFFFQDRNFIVSKALENDNVYQNRVTTAVSDLLQYVLETI